MLSSFLFGFDRALGKSVKPTMTTFYKTTSTRPSGRACWRRGAPPPHLNTSQEQNFSFHFKDI